jgi:arabinofuranosyltransferase
VVLVRRRCRATLAAVEIAIVAAATIYAIRGLARAPSWTVDDAWIVARYAENLAAHGELRWNLDGAAVEGFTSLSSVLVAALAALLHIAPVHALHALGEVGLVLSGALLLVLGRTLRAPPPAAGLVAAAHLSMAEHMTHATSGLETEAFIACGLVVLIALARALRSSRASVLPLAIAAFVLTMTRPEGAAASVAALGAVAFSRRGDRAALSRAGRSAGYGFGLPLLLTVAWRYLAYRAFVPNTFFAKQSGWNAAHLRDLAAVTNRHFLDLAMVAGACVLVLALLRGKVSMPRRSERLIALVAALSLGAVALVYARSEPVMDFAHRFAMHDLPWLDALCLIASSAAMRALRRLPAGTGLTLGALLGLASFSATSRGAAELSNEMTRMAVYDASAKSLYRPVVEWILANTASSATIAVYPDAGIIPYETKRRAVDFGRLNDAYLARAARSPNDIVTYFFARDPDVLVVSRRAPHRLWDEAAEQLVADPRFEHRYTLVLRRDAPVGGIGLMLYARRTP